jgi:hypothetical protein
MVKSSARLWEEYAIEEELDLEEWVDFFEALD